MKSKDIYLLDLDFEYKLWKNKLDFIRSDLGILIERINELKNDPHAISIPGPVIVARIESLRNRVNTCFSKIKVHEEEASHYAVDYPIDSKHQHFIDHEKSRYDMQELWQDYHDTTTEFMKNFG